MAAPIFPAATDPVFDPETFDPKDPATWTFTWELLKYFYSLGTTIDQTPQTMRRVSLTNQGAAIAPTPMPLPALSAGMYRISWVLRVTTPAAVSSAVSLTLAFTEGGVNQSIAGAVVNGNLVTSVDINSKTIKVDGNTAVTYATSVASVGVPALAYELELVVEALNAV